MTPALRRPYSAGKASGDECHRGDHARRERLAEDTDAVGQDDAIQAELQPVVIAADVQLPEGVLGGVGHLQHDLVQLHVVPPGADWMSLELKV